MAWTLSKKVTAAAGGAVAAGALLLGGVVMAQPSPTPGVTPTQPAPAAPTQPAPHNSGPRTGSECPGRSGAATQSTGTTPSAAPSY